MKIKNYDTFVKGKCHWKTGFFHEFWAFFHAFKWNITTHFPRTNSNRKLGFSMTFWTFLHVWKWKKNMTHFSRINAIKNWGFPWSLSVSSNAEVYTNDQSLRTTDAQWSLLIARINIWDLNLGCKESVSVDLRVSRIWRHLAASPSFGGQIAGAGKQ